MKLPIFRLLVLFIVIGFAVGCANIVPPEGGKKDTIPPKLVSVNPPDSQLNSRVSKLEMHFNEYVELNNPGSEIQISPLLPFPPTVLLAGKRITIKIPDTLLQPNTTYRISTNAAVKDLREGNPFKPYTYTFSTGGYFDSLKLAGIVYDAATGLPDTGAFLLLYPSTKSDSVVVKEKPRYIAKVGAGGKFSFDGLPESSFKIYALHDANSNLIYDGKNEMIAFIDSVIVPSDSVVNPIVLKSFREVYIDTLTAADVKSRKNLLKDPKKEKENEKLPLLYKAEVDTSSVNKRTFDITAPLRISFERRADTINPARIFLNYDSAGISVEVPFAIKRDTAKPEQFLLTAPWHEDALYTLRLLKGFAKDTLNNETMPSKYTFRTKSDEDYGKIEIHLPLKYKDTKYMLMVCGEPDTIYNKPVVDTVVKLVKLKPGNYKMRIIVDKNKNGKWDTGDLFEKRQPEEVIPYDNTILLKAGWENVVDFEVAKGADPRMKGTSPEKRDKPPVK